MLGRSIISEISRSQLVFLQFILIYLLNNAVVEGEGEHGIEVDALNVALSVFVAKHQQFVRAIFH